MSYIFKKKKYVNGYINNLEVIGVPNIDGSMISNFSTSNYLRFSKTPNLSSLTNWQMYFQITTGSGTADQQLLGGLTTDRAGIEIGIISSKLKLWLGSVSATNHDISTDNAVIGTTTIKPLTKYWLKLEFTGKQYILSISENGKDYNGEIAIHSSLPIRTNELSICLDKYAGNRPFLGIFDLDGFYITSSGKYVWIPYKRSKYDYNFSVFGLPIITNAPSCEVSGFSSSNYIALPKNFDVSDGSTWEMVYKFTTKDDVTTNSNITGGNGNGYRHVFIYTFSSKLCLEIGSNGSSWDIGRIEGGEILPNTTYFVKAEFTGSAYNLYYSQTNSDYVLIGSLETNKIIYKNELTQSIGLNRWSNGSNYPCLHSIDLSESYIKINGKLWWSCFRTTDNVIHKSDGSSKDYDYITTKCYSLKRKFLKKGYIPNGAVMGNVKFNETEVNGFSSVNDHILIPTIPTNTTNFEILLKVKFSNVTINQHFFNTSYNYGFLLSVLSDGKLCLYASSNGSSWNLFDAARGTTVLSNDIWYYIKCSFNGTEYKIQLSTDCKTWSDEIIRQSTTTIACLGGGRIGSGWSDSPGTYVTFDLNECYIKINDEYFWKSLKRCKYDYNFTMVGAPRISNQEGTCEVSGFSSSNYVKLPKTLNVSDGSSWDIVIKFKFNSQAKNQGILGYTGTGLFRSEISDSKFKLLLSSSTENWNIGQIESQTLETNTDYWVKISYKDNLYKLEMSTNGKDYTTESSITSTTKIIFSNELFFGNGRDGVLDGSIDLSQSYIKVNDKLWWSCFKQTTDIVYEEDGSEEDYDYQAQIGYNYCAPIKRYYKYVPWEQPKLTSNTSYGTLTGGGYYSGTDNRDYYHISDGIIPTTNQGSDTWSTSNSAIGWFNWELPEEIIIKGIKIYNRSHTTAVDYRLTGARFYTDSTKETPIGEEFEILTSQGIYELKDIPPEGIKTKNIYFYKTGDTYSGIGELQITALQIEPTTYDDYDFYEIEGEKIAHTFTINATPENAIVMINDEERNSLRMKEGSEVNWSVSLDGYKTQSGSLVLNEDTTIDVALREFQNYTLTINATPENATVMINGELTNSVTVLEGSEVSYEVSLDGYTTQSGTVVVNEDKVLDVVLEEDIKLLSCDQVYIRETYGLLTCKYLADVTYYPSYSAGAQVLRVETPSNGQYTSGYATGTESSDWGERAALSYFVLIAPRITYNNYDGDTIKCISTSDYDGSVAETIYTKVSESDYITLGGVKFFKFTSSHYIVPTLYLPENYVLNKSIILTPWTTIRSVISSTESNYECRYMSTNGGGESTDMSTTTIQKKMEVNIFTGEIFEK